MLLRKLIVFAVTSGLAKKAWDEIRKDQDQKRLPVDITEVIARPASLDHPSLRPTRNRRLGARRRREGPNA